MALRYTVLLSFIALALHNCPPLLAQDWQLVNSGVTDDLYDIFFIDKTTGWAVGADSTIIKTTDEGYTWFGQTGGVAEEYRCVYFRNPLLGWIGGTGGLVLHTTDGGDTWVRQGTDSVDYICAFDFVNDSVGWISAANKPYGLTYTGAIFRTTNGGKYWKEVFRTSRIPSEDSLYFGRFHDVDFIDELNGCVSSEIFSDRGTNVGSVLVTSDGGSTWKDISRWNSWIATYKAHMASPDTIYAGTYSGLAYTYNRGATHFKWLAHHFTCLDFSVINTSTAYALADRDSGVRIIKYDLSTGFSSLLWFEGIKFRSDRRRGFPTMGLCMLGADKGWVCGDSGKLWRYPAVIDGIEPMPAPGNFDISIESVYPNPLALDESGFATVRFSVRRESALAFEVRDVLGRVVFRNNNTTPYPPGLHEHTLPLHSLYVGMYFVGIQSARGTIQTKMMVVK